LSLGGTLFTSTDREVGFGVLLVTGIVVLFAGFLVSGSGAPTTTPSTPAMPEGLDGFGRELWDIVHGQDSQQRRADLVDDAIRG